MGYRKIVVCGQEYEYVIGKSHTKIKGIGVYLNSNIGKRVVVAQYCECCGEPMASLYPNHHIDPIKLSVTPSDIVDTIKKASKSYQNPLPRVFSQS